MLIPTHPDQYDSNWLASKINPQAGQLNGFDYKPVGTGQVSDSYRLFLDWENSGPASIISKCPARNQDSLKSGRDMLLYDTEVRWYQTIGRDVRTRTPHCYHADISDNHTDFVLLLEDICSGRQIDQIKGCNVAEVAQALTEMAHLHSYIWDDAKIKDIAWLNQKEGNKSFVSDFMPAIYPQWADRYKQRLDPDILKMGGDFVKRIEDYLRPRNQPLVIAHNDFRLDNMLYTDNPEDPLVVLDWQTVAPGTPMVDVAYCISTSFSQHQERAVHEQDLLHLYLKKLSLPTSKHYAFEQAWQEYRLAAFSGLIMAIISAMVVERTERGDAMFAVMAERSGYQVLALDSMSLLY